MRRRMTCPHDHCGRETRGSSFLVMKMIKESKCITDVEIEATARPMKVAAIPNRGTRGCYRSAADDFGAHADDTSAAYVENLCRAK
jgi:hypothetical protein